MNRPIKRGVGIPWGNLSQLSTSHSVSYCYKIYRDFPDINEREKSFLVFTILYVKRLDKLWKPKEEVDFVRLKVLK